MEKEEMGWQPIESAPRDGTEVLVTYQGRMWIDKWVTFSSVSKGGYWLDFESEYDSKEQPTYWMPLPDLPTVCEFESCPLNLPEGHLISDHPTADWLKDKEIERLQNERNELAQGLCTHEEHEANETWLIQRLKEQGILRDPARPVECPKCGWIPEPCPKS